MFLNRLITIVCALQRTTKKSSWPWNKARTFPRAGNKEMWTKMNTWTQPYSEMQKGVCLKKGNLKRLTFWMRRTWEEVFFHQKFRKFFGLLQWGCVPTNVLRTTEINTIVLHSSSSTDLFLNILTAFCSFFKCQSFFHILLRFSWKARIICPHELWRELNCRRRAIGSPLECKILIGTNHHANLLTPALWKFLYQWEKRTQSTGSFQKNTQCTKSSGREVFFGVTKLRK